MILTEEIKSFAAGVPVGYEVLLLRVHAVFLAKGKRKLSDNSIFKQTLLITNQRMLSLEKLEEKIR